MTARVSDSSSLPLLADLRKLSTRLLQVNESIQSFDAPLPQLPIIDISSSSSHTSKTPNEADKSASINKEGLPGLRFLRDEVKRDSDILENFLREHENSPNLQANAALSTNAPYLIAVWDELVNARRLVAIYRTFSPTPISKGKDKQKRGNGASQQEKKAPKSQTRAVKVDVVAENGARWVRVNTIKNSRLMMEFREIDSYLTSDDEDEDLNDRPRLAQIEFDNSVLRMGRELLAAAKANPVSVPTLFSGLVSNSSSSTASMTTPKVTIRLTRLNPSLKDGAGNGPDPRIRQTIDCLHEMGIDVQLGERSHPHHAPFPKKHAEEVKAVEPTTNINLDLSALIALISDITHSPLPVTEVDAYVRFVPSQSYLEWKKDRAKLVARQNRTNRHSQALDDADGSDEDSDPGAWEDSGQHSRALSAQAIQEMNKGILEEIHERLSITLRRLPILFTDVKFWTTNEARQRCIQIVSKIGGKRERQRADALLGSTICSRTSPIPAQVCKDVTNGVLDVQLISTNPQHDGEGTCSKLPAEAYWGHSRYPTAFLPLVPVHLFPSTTLPPAEEDGGRGYVPGTSPRSSFFDALTLTCTRILAHNVLPVSHSVSMSSGASSTTEEVLEEIPPATQTSFPKLTMHTVSSMLAGSSRGYTTLTTNRSSVKVVLKEMRKVCGRGGYEPGMWEGEGDADVPAREGGGVEKAALWILDPRSLAEGMRSDDGF